MGPKDVEEMANSVEPDQAARSSLIWICTVCPDLSVQKLRNIMDVEEKPNSVEPDQAARSSLIWICTVCPDLSVRKLRNIMVT